MESIAATVGTRHLSPGRMLPHQLLSIPLGVRVPLGLRVIGIAFRDTVRDIRVTNRRIRI